MTDKQTPPNWVLIEAAKRSGLGCNYSVEIARMDYNSGLAFRALCDMIERYEQPPLDPEVEALIEALIDLTDGRSGSSTASYAKCLRAALADRGFVIAQKGCGND